MAKGMKASSWYEPWWVARRRAARTLRDMKGALLCTPLWGLLLACFADAVVSSLAPIPANVRLRLYLAGVAAGPFLILMGCAELLVPQLIFVKAPEKGAAGIYVGHDFIPFAEVDRWRTRRLMGREDCWLLRIRQYGFHCTTIVVSPKIDPSQIDPNRLVV